MRSAVVHLALAFSVTSLATAGSPPFAGEYRSKEKWPAGTTIEVLPNGTFVYAAWNDLESYRTTGTWRLIAPHILAANSTAIQPDSSMTSAAKPHDRILVEVNDADGIPIPGVTVSLTCAGRKLQQVTDVEGLTSFAACPRYWISADLSGFIALEGREVAVPHNDLHIILQARQFLIRNALWLIHDDKLYELGDGLPKVTK